MANPLQTVAVRRKIIYVAAILALFSFSMVWRGKIPLPLSDENRVRLLQMTANLSGTDRDRFVARVETGQETEFFPQGPPAPPSSRVAAFSDWLASKTIEGQAAPSALDLRELDQGDPEIAGTAARLSLLGSRGLAITLLWTLAIEQQKRNEFQEFELLIRAVTRLQPNFITPWIYQSWNLTYNVSVENDRLSDMYFYIARGIELLAEGERLNKKSPDMRYQIAFYYQNKFGVSDKVRTLRSLMQLSCIPPDDRDADKRFRKPDGTIDLAQFQDFCRKNPQLVRRLREELRYRRPEEIVAFLEANARVPSRFDRNTNQLAKAADQFPVLPPQFSPDELHSRSESIDDTFDAFHAARAWYEYSSTVIPPPSSEPTGLVRLKGEDQFKYRLPKQPALIIFRQGPARAQSYLAERMTKEGWFDSTTTWYPDELADTDDERWFPRGEGDQFGPGEGLQTNASSLEEWRKSYERWKRHGELNGLVLDVARYAQYVRDAQNAPNDAYLHERTDEQLAAMGLTRAQAIARSALRNYEINRTMTNFPFFLAQSEAESDPGTVRARSMLWDAQRMIARSKPRAIEMYANSLAKWREALLNFPQYHHPDTSTKSDKTEEDTYEYFLSLVSLLEQTERVDQRTTNTIEALRTLVPVDGDRLMTALSGQQAEAEAAYLVSAADERVKRRVTELKLLPENVQVGTLAYFDHPAIRELVAREFSWLGEYKTEAKDPTNLWVTDDVKDAVRDRMGMSRVTQPTALPTPEIMPQGQDALAP